MVKGKSQPVRAVEVGDLVGTREVDRAAVPFVGRADELAALRQALDAVRAGRGSLVDLAGDPGIGKSRLVAEALAGADDVPVLVVPCEQYESATPYFPFRRLLRAALGVPYDADAAELAAVLAQRVEEEAPHLVRWLPLIGIPLDLALLPTRETEELDEQFRKARLEDVVTELLGLLVADPSVLVVEDAHVMDDSSTDLLQRMAEDLDERVRLTARPPRDLAPPRSAR
jgi:predicted ATPase